GDSAGRADRGVTVAGEARPGTAPGGCRRALQGAAVLPAVHHHDRAVARAHLARAPALSTAPREPFVHLLERHPAVAVGVDALELARDAGQGPRRFLARQRAVAVRVGAPEDLVESPAGIGAIAAPLAPGADLQRGDAPVAVRVDRVEVAREAR